MKRGTTNHPKMHALAETLSMPLFCAVGILEMLWHHAAQVTPRGDIGSLPDRAIAHAVDWKKKPVDLIEALVFTRWVHRHNEWRLYLHDWPDHCEQSVVRFLEYNHKTFLPVYGFSLENRKRKSRDSLPSREAKAKAEALDVPSGGAGGALTFDFESFWDEFDELYPAKGRSRQIDAKTWYIEKLMACADPALFHDQVMAKIQSRWLSSEKWAKGFVMRQDEFIRQECWNETPKQIPPNPIQIRQKELEAEGEKFRAGYRQWLADGHNGSEIDYVDWQIDQEHGVGTAASLTKKEECV